MAPTLLQALAWNKQVPSPVAFVRFLVFVLKIPFLVVILWGVNSKFHPSGTILFMFFVAGN